MRAFLVVAVIVLIVVDLVLAWILAGEKLLYPMDAVARSQTAINDLAKVQLSRTNDAEFLEEKINTLNVSSANLAVINQIIQQQQDLVSSVKSDRAVLDQKIVALEALQVPPYRTHPAQMDRSLTVTLGKWVDHASAYYALRAKYFTVLQNIAYLQEQIAALSFSTDDSSAALAQYNNLLATYTATRQVVDAFASEQDLRLTILQTALDQEQSYLDLSRQFYEADKSKNIAKQKTLRDQLVEKEKLLTQNSFYDELADYEKSVLGSEHATMQLVADELASTYKKLQ